MTADLSDENKPVIQPRPSRVWRVLRWVPLIALIVVSVVLLALFLMGGMQKISAWYTAQTLLPLLGLIALLATVIRSLVKRRLSRLGGLTLLAALIALLPAIMLIKPLPFPSSLAKTTPSATVRLPANGRLRVAWGGDKIETNYHVVVPDQRWAYDLIVEPFPVKSTRLEDYGCYGVPVVAPVSGLVTRAHDGEPDETPGAVSNNLEAPLGNHVVIQMETGTYLLIAHMKPGSVLVKSGETVEEGQEIGQCGNSGNTSGPHIHIHHQRQDPAVFPLNFAEGLPLYFRDLDGPAMPVGGVKLEGDKFIFLGDVVQHTGP